MNSKQSSTSRSLQTDFKRLPGSPMKQTNCKKADFNQITSHSLKRYKREFKLRMPTGVNKQELATAVSKHFSELPPPEDEEMVINGFLHAVRQQIRDRQSENDLNVLNSAE